MSLVEPIYERFSIISHELNYEIQIVFILIISFLFPHGEWRNIPFQNNLLCTIYKTHAMNNVNAKNTRILSVHSRRPYFFSNRLECKIVPAVFCNSSFVPSTLADDEARVSKVIALFWVVSDKCRDMANIFSVTLSCWNTKLVLLCLAAPRFRTSPVLEKSSCLSSFSISIMVLMLARRNAWRVLLSNEHC